MANCTQLKSFKFKRLLETLSIILETCCNILRTLCSWNTLLNSLMWWEHYLFLEHTFKLSNVVGTLSVLGTHSQTLQCGGNTICSWNTLSNSPMWWEHFLFLEHTLKLSCGVNTICSWNTLSNSLMWWEHYLFLEHSAIYLRLYSRTTFYYLKYIFYRHRLCLLLLWQAL